MIDINIQVFSIEKDGMPDKFYSEDQQTCHIGFFWDGNIYCGWPLFGLEGYNYGKDVWSEAEFAHELHGVTHWFYIAVPFHSIEKAGE